MRSISSSGVRANSSALVPRLSEPGSLCCFAQRYTSSAPSLRRRSMAKGGWAQYLSSRCRAARSSASMRTPGVHRKPAVRVAQHLFGVTTLQQTPAHEGAPNASAQIGLNLGHSGGIDSTGRVKGDARC
jgi:hypothetical protein